jgi:hypothetical protein
VLDIPDPTLAYLDTAEAAVAFVDCSRNGEAEEVVDVATVGCVEIVGMHEGCR